MFDGMGLEWPDAELGPLCPGVWVEEVDLENLPGDSGLELEALDERLSLEMARIRRRRAKEKRVQWATDKVASLFFEAQTQKDLDEAFTLMATVQDRGFIAAGVIQTAKARVKKAKQTHIDKLRALNRTLSTEAARHGYRVSEDAVNNTSTKLPEDVRQKAWCLFRPKNWPSNTWKVGRGSDLQEGAIVLDMNEQRILEVLQSL